MNLRITEDKKIKIGMEDQILEAIELFGDELEGEMTSLAQYHIFQVNEDTEPLDKKITE